MSGEDVLLDALCRAAFQPQQQIYPDQHGNPQVTHVTSPLLMSLAQMLTKAFSEDAHLRATVLAELLKAENVSTLAGELAKGVGRMRVNTGYGYGNTADVPGWVKDALSTSLTEWLGTEDAEGLVPQMLKNSTITITVERKDANAK